MPRFILLIAFLTVARGAAAQTQADSLRGIPRFQLEYTGLALSGAARTGVPMSDMGARASVKADESGNLSMWVGANNVLRDFHLAFQFAGVDSTHELAGISQTVVKRPEGLTFVYSHPAFTVREHVFVPLNEPGVIILLDVQTVRPLEVLVRTNGDTSSSAIRRILRFTPATSRQYIPVIIAGGVSADSITATYERLSSDPKRYWLEKVAHYRALRSETLSVETPDARMNQALQWANVELDLPTATDLVSALAMTAIGGFNRVRETLANPNVPATPVWMLAAYEYWIASGDDSFLREMWPNISGAFKRSAARDSNGDGLIEDPAMDIHDAAVWVSAVGGVHHMAVAITDAQTRTRAAQVLASAQTTLDSAFWNGAQQSYAGSSARRYALTVRPATAMSFGLLDAERSGRTLRELSSSSITADWGARALSQSDSLYDPLDLEHGAVTPIASGYTAMAHYRQHRGWSGFDLVSDIARMSLDFERGRTPGGLSGAFFQRLDTAANEISGAAMIVLPFVRGTLGWQTDAPRRAAVLEPHLPPEWQSARINRLRLGRDRMDVTITREHGMYAVHLRRLTAGPSLSIRVAPALPLGARLERIIVDDVDVTVQAEESVHDVHGVAEVTLIRDAEIEFHYEGGFEVIAPAQQTEIGDTSREIRILDFRREGRDYILSLEGPAGTSHVVELSAETRLRAATGADSFEQTEERVAVRVTMPAGSDVTRKTIRLRP